MPIPVDVATCKKGSFWSKEMLAGKVKNKQQHAEAMKCCPLFKKKPSELPQFCPPTANWCKWEESNGWTDDVKDQCCKMFGKDLTSCKPAQKGSAKPTKSTAQVEGKNIPAFDLVVDGNTFKNDSTIDDKSSDQTLDVQSNTFDKDSTIDFGLLVMVI